VAQKRQRSKQRQAERRAQRLAERGGDGPVRGREDARRQRDPERQELEENVDLQVGAPPEEVGRSDFATRHEEPPPPDFEIDDAELEEDAEAAGEEAAARGPRGVRGGERGRAAEAGQPLPRERGRVVEFLRAVWAELQRVQWPNRRQTTQLTGVVLVFVLIVGAYLGGLDAIFSQLIQSIL
jgi:preprotein translocase SecE subunit